MGLFAFKVTVHMFGIKGYPHRWSLSLVLAFTDGFLILIGVFLGGVLRFWGNMTIVRSEYFFWKIMVLILVIQIPFYYFELYDLRNFGKRVKMAILLLESLGTSFLLLAILYYLVPPLAIGRGILAAMGSSIFLMAFLWRRTYAGLCRKLIRERVLIVGTGELSKRVAKEIHENAKDSFEIIGFVAE
jgi:FlaA1/EpsC-like NDP-sugar epimerase